MRVIAIDGMGGDLGLNATIPGIRRAFDEIGDSSLKFKLFARRKEAQDLIQKYNLGDCILLHDTEPVISEDDHHIKVIQKGSFSSLGKAIISVSEKRANAVISSGSTAAYLLLCHQYLKRVPAVHKVALQATLPTCKGEVVVLDLGATLTATDEDLVQFAKMGHVLTQNLFEFKKNPSIGLLNVGKEEMKGLPHLIKAHQALKNNKHLNYKGFVEGTDILSGDVDVVITDGFAGNIALKSIEGASSFIRHNVRESFKKSFLKRFFSFGMSQSLVDKRQYNGAIFLGFSGLAIKSHGNSDAVAFSQAIKMAYKLVSNDFIDNFEKYMAKTTKHSKVCTKQKS